ncbi:MAG: hypothetical protein OXC62_11580 [Aestuariivita sp.]|nr:hypothetical protein [Aestuariivita sp.]
MTIAARNEDYLSKAATEIDGDVRYEVNDISEWASVKSMFENTTDAESGIEVVCANAGAFP